MSQCNNCELVCTAKILVEALEKVGGNIDSHYWLIDKCKEVLDLKGAFVDIAQGIKNECITEKS